MKKMHLLTVAILLAFPLPSLYAVDAHHPEKQAQGKSMPVAGQKGMSGGMMGNMQTHMKEMMQQMQELHKTRDPDKRDLLVEQHMQTMREGMKMMQDMGGGMMMGKGNMEKNKQTGGDMKTRMDMMEQRVEMMQMMMDQMMKSREQANETHKIRRKSNSTTKIIR